MNSRSREGVRVRRVDGIAGGEEVAKENVKGQEIGNPLQELFQIQLRVEGMIILTVRGIVILLLIAIPWVTCLVPAGRAIEWTALLVWLLLVGVVLLLIA